MACGISKRDPPVGIKYHRCRSFAVGINRLTFIDIKAMLVGMIHSPGRGGMRRER
jgi:hypothetical protein